MSRDDNTEIKVPINVKMGSSYDCSVNSAADSDLREFHRLEILFRELPCVLFVDRVLRDYSASESDLEHTRAMLFDTVREDDDFPFGLQAELKRREYTPKGDTVSVKLTNDIHTLLRVIEGGDDVSILKDMLSTSRGRTHVRSLVPSSSSTPGKPRHRDSSRIRSRSFATPSRTDKSMCTGGAAVISDTNSSIPYNSISNDVQVKGPSHGDNQTCLCKSETTVLSNAVSQL